MTFIQDIYESIIGPAENGDRILELEPWAHAHSLSLEIDDPDEEKIWAQALPFLNDSSLGTILNVMRGSWKNTPVVGFDLRDQGPSWTSCVLAEIEASTPTLSITHRSQTDRIKHASAQFGYLSELGEFNDKYHVSCDDHEFASAVLDARMIQWLLDSRGQHMSYDVAEASLLGFTALRGPQELDQVFDHTIGFRDHIPKVVGNLYPADL